MNRDPASQSAVNQGSTPPNGGPPQTPQEAQQLAAALGQAAKAAKELEQATQRTQRLYRNDPAVKAARELAEATRQAAREREKMGQAGRGGGGGGGGAPVPGGGGGGGVSSPAPGQAHPPGDPRHNPALDAAFGVVPLSPARPQPPADRTPPDRPAPAPTADRQRAAGPPVSEGMGDPRSRGVPPDRGDAMATTGGRDVPPPVVVPASPAPGEGRPGLFGRFAERAGAAREIGGDVLRSVSRMSVVMGNYYDAETAALTTRRERSNRFLDTIPFVGELSRAADHEDDVKKYGAEGVRGMKDRMFRTNALADLLGQNEYGPLSDLRDTRDRAAAMREANDRVGGVSIVPEVTDRATLPDQRRYAENREMITAMERYRAKRVEATAADKEALKIAERRVQVDGRMAVIQKQVERQERRVKELDKLPGEKGYNPDSPPIDLRDAMNELAISRKQLAELGGESSRLRDREAMTKNRAAEAKMAERMAFADVGQLTLDQERRREEESAAGARRLGLMGVDGRMQGMLAKRMIDQIGVENAPGELIQQAMAFAPETVGNMAERAGTRFQDGARRLAPNEPGFQNLDRLRSSVDAIERGVAKERNTATAEALTEIVERLLGLVETRQADTGGDLDAIRRRVESLEANERLRNQR